MRWILRAAGALAVLLSMVPVSAAVVPDADIRAILSERIGGQKGVGIVVGIIDPHGQRIVSAGGFDGKTLFEIGSVAKVFTALLLSDMVERGEVKLNDRAAHDLPITFAELATHTSGLPFMPPVDVATRAQMYEYLREQPRRGNAAWDYSNLGYWLLGEALATRTHTDFDRLLRRRILDPLQLRETTAHLTPAQATRLAPGYDASLHPAAPLSSMPAYSMMSAAGMGWYSSADDLLRFLAYVLGLRRSPLQPAMAAMLDTTRAASSPRSRQALGWVIEGDGGDRLIVHDGGTLGYAACVAWDPTHRTGVVVLSNQFGDVGDIARHLLRPSIPLHKPTPAKPKEITLPPAMLALYPGRYEAPGEGVFVIELTDGHLTIEAPSDWGLPKLQLHPASDREFFAAELPLRVTFETKDGHVAEMIVYPPRGQGGVAAKRASPR
ncbi:MAG TPA: serine hydrolase [Thermoanaerobaculia bacterium]